MLNFGQTQYVKNSTTKGEAIIGTIIIHNQWEFHRSHTTINWFYFQNNIIITVKIVSRLNQFLILF